MSDTGAIAQISRAYQLLAQATDLTDIKAVRDMAEAARLYARARDLGIDTENQAAEIKVRAIRKLGEVLTETEKQKPGQYQQRSPESTVAVPPSLADVGISRKESSESQAVAALPAKEFEAILAETKEAGKPIATKPMVREGRKRKREQAGARMNAPRRRSAGPVNVQNIHDANLRATFQKWLLEATKIAALSPERIVEVLTVADAQRAEASLERFIGWVETFKRARADGSGLRAIGEG